MLRWKWGLGLVIFILLAVAVGYGISAYPQWRQDRLIGLAREAMKAKDWRSAGISLREALSSNRLNPELYRAMAEFDLSRRSRQAIQWRKTVLELEPGGVEDLYLLAANSVALGAPEEAKNALQQLPPEEQDSERAWNLQAALTLTQGQIEEGRALLSQMAERFGRDDRLELNLAKLRLLSPEEEERELGRGTLETFRQHEEHGAEAIRALTKDALERGNLELAEGRVNELLKHSRTEAQDFLLRLAIIQRQDPVAFSEELTRLMQTVGDDVYSAQFYLNWLLQRGWPDEILALVPEMHAQVKEAAVVSILLGQAQMMTGRWADFVEVHDATDWAELDFLRLAYLARAKRLNGARVDEWEPFWQQSVALAGQQPQSLGVLAETATGWGWGDRALPLWKQLSGGPQAIRALQQMATYYRSQRQARPLYNIYREALRLLPRDVAVRNNYASYSLLLGEDLEAAHRLADQLYQENRGIPEIAGTYAHSLLLQGKPEAALEVIHTLDDRDRQIAEIALIEARALALLGRRPAARTVLATIDPKELLIEDEGQLRLLQSELEEQ